MKNSGKIIRRESSSAPKYSTQIKVPPKKRRRKRQSKNQGKSRKGGVDGGCCLSFL